MAKYLDDAALSELVSQIKTLVNTKYTKPSGGIPASDLAESYYLSSNPSGYTKVESSSTNGNIKINNTETTVYTLPSDVAFTDVANTFTQGQIISRTDSGPILKLTSAASDTNFLLERQGGATCVLESGGSIGLFGTKSNHGLQIRTNYVNRMSFDTSGGVTLATAPAANSNSNQIATTKWVNDKGYITGISSGDVVSALGFTPYNSTNPSNYQTSSEVSSAINAKAVRYDTSSQGLTTTQQANARTNIGAGTSNFDGVYSSLTGLPTLGTASSKDTGTTSGTIPLIGSNGKLDSSIIPTQQITIDSALSSTSENPVQNKVINTALSNKMDKVNPVGSGSISLNRADNSTVGNYSSTFGQNNTASGDTSFAEGQSNTASGTLSHSEGWQTTASGSVSHSEGFSTTASGAQSHAEGFGTVASGIASHAEGFRQLAIGQGATGDYSHSEGVETTSSGSGSHSEGNRTTASGNFSHASGYYTTSSSRSQFVLGEYNVLDSGGSATTRGNYVEIVGNGTADNARSNARTLDWNGNEVLAGTLKASGLTDGTTTKTMAEILAGSSLPSDLAYIDSTGTATTEATLLDNYYTKSQTYSQSEVTSLLGDIVKCLEMGVVTIGTFGQSVRLTATIPSGYKFLCWLQPATTGWVGSVYAETPNSATTNFWNASSSGGGTLRCCYLVIKDT